jgi:protein TonB
MSKRMGEQGTVVLRVLVKSDGTAGTVEVKSSSGFPRLDQSATEAVKSWRFNPATIDGMAVDEWYLLPIPFKLQN